MDNYKRIGILTVFAVSMGFLEAAIVVYLRELYYPNGFEFPLQQMSSKIAFIEVIREGYTIVMLLAIALITGKHKMNRFACFLYSFAVWDIFYYIFLKFTISWPDSIFTWDILFLIPTTWTGPVIAPIIVSFTMIFSAAIIFYKNKGKAIASFNTNEFIILVIGAIVIFISFIWDYSNYVFQYYSFAEIFKNISNPKLSEIMYNYIPQQFNWLYFWIGEGMAIIAIILFMIRRND